MTIAKQPGLRGLTLKQEKFCYEYVKTGSPTAAYKAAYDCGGSKGHTVSKNADRVLKMPHVNDKISELRSAIAQKGAMEIEDCLSRLVAIATADPNELIQHRRINCRHCYGIDFFYQWTTIEYALAVARAVDFKKPVPTCEGGEGYDLTKNPNPKCPECNGLGKSHVHVADTRNLTGAAKLLYKGIKQTKDGPEILMRDQDLALQSIAKYLGMFKDRMEISGKNGAPFHIPVISTVTTDPIEAAKIYQKIMKGN